MIGFLFLLVSSLASPAHAAVSMPDLAFRSGIETSDEPLQTEDFTRLDPGAVNPHLQRWALSRVVEILGLTTRKLPTGAFGVSVSALDSRSVIHLRGPGAWYQTIQQFPCQERVSSPDFATQEGTRVVANEAAKLWDEILFEKKNSLARRLAHVALTSDAEALDTGQRVFKEWLGGLDLEWRARVSKTVLTQQWQKDRAEALALGVCHGYARATKASEYHEVWPDSWMSLPDLERASPSPLVMPVFRAPARRVGGYFTIRLDLQVGLRTVSGQFVIDPASPGSIISPSWLEAQGVRPPWVEIPEAALAHVRVRAGQGRTGLAKTAFFDRVTASGYALGVQRFQLYEVSEVFDEPEFPVPCCSGILGQDFLSRYVLEFRPGDPMEVVAWPVAGFGSAQLAEGDAWAELRRLPSATLGLFDFAVACSPRVRALGVPKICDDPATALKNAVAPIILDVPHGRIWYSKSEAAAPLYKNRSGLNLAFGYAHKSRVLLVKSIGDTPGARALAKDGLRVGTEILELGGVPSAQLDAWKVQRLLAGVYGKVVAVKWEKNQSGRIESAPLPLLN
ncbi:MAG: PDZ domain-containing protein [Oligoflexia bacterium]|nr:PDZ domain-containing protein [Oligoflexia bacterium]